MAILKDLTAEERIAQLEAELAAEKTKNVKDVVVKVSAKGAVQLNGIRRFPVTFYANEFETIFAMKDEIEAFIESNRGRLATK